MYASYRVPYSIDPYADDNVGTEQMPEHAYPQTDVTAQDQQEALTQKTNVIDDFLRQLAMHIAGGTGIISRPPGADLLARGNASSDTSPPSSDDDAEEAGDRHNVPEDKQTPEEIPDPPQENKARVISPELRNEIDRVKGIKPDAVGNALRDSLAEKNTGAGTSPYGLAKPGEGMDFSVHSEVPAQTLYGDDYRVQMTGSYDDYPGIEFLDTPQGKNGMPAGTTIVKKSSGISLFKNVRDSLPKYQSTVDNMQSRDVYQIVANYELEDGKRVSNGPAFYTAYNTVAKRTDYVIGVDDLSKFLQSAVGYRMKADLDAAPGYIKEGNAAAVSLADGEFGATARHFGNAWGDAVTSPDWWLGVAANFAGGAMAKESALLAQEARIAHANNSRAATYNGDEKSPYFIGPRIVESVDTTPYILLKDTKTGTDSIPLFITGDDAIKKQWIVKANGYTGQDLGNVSDPLAAIKNIVQNGFEQKGNNANFWDHKYPDSTALLSSYEPSKYRGVSGNAEIPLKNFISNGDPDSYFVRFETSGQIGYNIDKIFEDNQWKLSEPRKNLISQKKYFNEIEFSVISRDANKHLKNARLFYKDAQGKIINMGVLWMK